MTSLPLLLFTPLLRRALKFNELDTGNMVNEKLVDRSAGFMGAKPTPLQINMPQKARFRLLSLLPVSQLSLSIHAYNLNVSKWK